MEPGREGGGREGGSRVPRTTTRVRGLLRPRDPAWKRFQVLRATELAPVRGKSREQTEI